MRLIELTNDLLLKCQKAEERFFYMREENKTADFYLEVKPAADALRVELTEWQQLAKQWRDTAKPKYIHEQQFAQVVDAMEQFIVQSFYKETSKKRFLQSIHSVTYTLTTILRYLQEQEGDIHDDL